MHEYAQKSTSTTSPRSPAILSGAEFSQPVMPVNSGAGPQSDSVTVPRYASSWHRCSDPVPPTRGAATRASGSAAPIALV